MSSWLVALRIARREARRAKGRTALIITMIALPVMALSFAAVTYDMSRLTPKESLAREMGAADGLLSWWSTDEIPQTPPALMDGAVPAGTPASEQPSTLTPSAAHLRMLLPPGSTLTPYWQGGALMRTSGGTGGLDAFGFDMANPVTAGLGHIVSGRAPRADNEVAVSKLALIRLGAHVGGQINTASTQPGYLQTYTVVGIEQVDSDLGETIIFMPSQQPDSNTWLVSGGGAIDETVQARLNAYGVQVQSRYLELNPPPWAIPDQHLTYAGFSVFGIGSLIAGLGLLEVILLAGPAFTVGARRRQRDLALVATTGGSPATLRGIVLADGVVGGFAAAVVGLILGVSAALVARPYLEQHLTHSAFGAYRLYPLALAGIVGLAILTGVLGALLPAVTASRQDVAAALAGRRGLTRSRLRWLLVGIAGVVIGGVVALDGAHQHNSTIVLAGLVVGELGLVLCTPSLVGLVAKVGRFLPVAPRIALRDTARRRAAAAPAISAVMAAVAGSVALTVYLGSSADQATPYQSSLPPGSFYVAAQQPAKQRADEITKIDSVVTKALPSATLTTLTSYDSTQRLLVDDMPVANKCPYQPDPMLPKPQQLAALKDHRCDDAIGAQYTDDLAPFVTNDPAVLTATLGLTGSQLSSAVAMLDNGGAVVTDPRYVAHGVATMHTVNLNTDPGNGTVFTDDPSLVIKTSPVPAVVVHTDVASAVVVSPAVLATFGLRQQPAGVVVTPAHPMSETTRDAIQKALSDASLSSPEFESVPTDDKQLIAIILAIAAGVIALGAAGIATGLAAVDGRGDLTTLGAVGATPRMRRILALAQSGTIAGLGSLMGATAGLGAGWAVLYGINQVYSGTWPSPRPYPIEVPWVNLIASLVVVPVVAMLGAGLLTRSRLPSERRG